MNKEYIISVTTDNERVAKFVKRILDSCVASHAVKLELAYVSEPQIEEKEITSECV